VYGKDVSIRRASLILFWEYQAGAPNGHHWAVSGARAGELILGAYNTLTYIAMDIFTIVPTFIGLVFIIVVGTILFKVGKGLAEWANNNSMPVQSEHVRIVAKRSETRGHSEGPVSTRYYVTFELLSGDRRELSIHGKEYGMLSEGDEGTLTYQGTRYRGFDRDRG